MRREKRREYYELVFCTNLYIRFGTETAVSSREHIHNINSFPPPRWLKSEYSVTADEGMVSVFSQLLDEKNVTG